MHNLIIIGNGFDLAHNLKTSYNHFIRYMVDLHCADKSNFSDLLDFNFVENYDDLMRQMKEGSSESSIRFNNLFVKILLNDIVLKDWCDIEQKYFEILINISEGKDKTYTNPKQLNLDFDKLKNYLIKYLEIEGSKGKKIDSYSEFFKRIDSPDTIILNFNYTKTIQTFYQQEIKQSNLIHIHGELENKQNPVVFGYAANHDESRRLSKMGNEYMINIKKHLYKSADNENLLVQYLKNTKIIDVSIMGHSCGTSDQLILNQIFTDDNVGSIRIYYFENPNHHLDIRLNVDRIMNNDDKFGNRLKRLTESQRMPQYNDTNPQFFEFKKFIHTVRKDQEQLIEKNKPSSSKISL